MIAAVYPAERSERDGVFTPFMRRVRAVLEGEDAALDSLDVQSPALRTRSRAVDEWFQFRARAEQVIAEANAILEGVVPLVDLDDEAGTGRLGFTVRRGDRWAILQVEVTGPDAIVVLERWSEPSATGVEPTGIAVLEDLDNEADSREVATVSVVCKRLARGHDASSDRNPEQSSPEDHRRNVGGVK